MRLLTGRRRSEVDQDGWQKLPLHLEMAMMQQAAHGEDGVSHNQSFSRLAVLLTP